MTLPALAVSYIEWLCTSGDLAEGLEGEYVSREESRRAFDLYSVPKNDVKCKLAAGGASVPPKKKKVMNSWCSVPPCTSLARVRQVIQQAASKLIPCNTASSVSSQPLGGKANTV